MQRDWPHWLEKDLRALSRFDALYSSVGDSAELRETSLEHLKRYILPNELLPALARAHFETAVAQTRQRHAQDSICNSWTGLESFCTFANGSPATNRCSIGSPARSDPKLFPRSTNLGPKATIRATNPLADELSSLIPSRFLARIDYVSWPICRAISRRCSSAPGNGRH